MRRLLPAAVLGNLALSGVHGVVHVVAGVAVAPWQGAVLAVGLVLAPAGGLLLDRRGRARGAVALVGAGAAAALTMEAPWHFLLANPDHVAHAGGAAFAATALLTTAGDALVVLAAVESGLAAGSTGNAADSHR